MTPAMKPSQPSIPDITEAKRSLVARYPGLAGQLVAVLS